jgi:methanogenic corrinoid protein MtbC1
MALARLPSPVDIAEALLSGDSGTVLAAAHRYMSHGGPPFVVDALARPVMEVVGERWKDGCLSVAEEHAASELLRGLLTYLLHGLGRHDSAPKAVIACVQGERHFLGARLISQVLSCDGWNVRFLGADTPAMDLALFVAREQPAFAGLSVALSENLSETRLTLELLRRTVPHIPLIAGGRAAAALADEPGQPWHVVYSAEELLSWTRSSTLWQPSLC